MDKETLRRKIENDLSERLIERLGDSVVDLIKELNRFKKVIKTDNNSDILDTLNGILKNCIKARENCNVRAVGMPRGKANPFDKDIVVNLDADGIADILLDLVAMMQVFVETYEAIKIFEEVGKKFDCENESAKSPKDWFIEEVDKAILELNSEMSRLHFKLVF